MSDLGNLLKKARMEKGITLDDLEESTKIRKRYLEAIEEGNYKVLPGNFYVRAFIKSYAEAVGLNPDEVFQLYRNVIPTNEVEPVEPIRRKRSVLDSQKTEKFAKWTSGILFWLFVLLILGIIYYFIDMTYMDNGKGKVSENDRLTQKTQPDTKPIVEEIKSAAPNTVITQETPSSQPKPKPVVSFIEVKNSTYQYKVSNTDSLQVDLKIIGDRCWLQVKQGSSNGQLLESKEYKNGETPSWKVNDALYIRLGKPLAVEVKINGEPVTIPETVNPINLQIQLKS